MSRRTLLASMLAAGLIGAAFPADAQQPDVYRIGAILSMSGHAPHYGTVMSRGALIAVDEINAAGCIDGVTVELVNADHNSGNTQTAVAGKNRMNPVSQ